jgi:hypothetical protein
MYRDLINKKKIKKTFFDYVLIFCTLNIITGYAFAVEPN